MFEAKKILFPVHAPALSKWFIPQVVMLAERLGADVTLLHLTGGEPGVDAGREFRELARWLERRVGSLEVREIAAGSDAARTIVEASYAEPYDLIMIPSRRRRLGWLRGASVAERVARNCRCTVWTAPEGASPGPDAFRNIVCALDLGPESAGVLSAAADMADLLEGSLSIVHGMPEIDESLLQLAALDELPVTLSRQAALREIGRLQRLTGTVAPVHIETGELTRAVRRALNRLSAGLLVLGSGASAERTGRLGPNVLPMMRASSCPVLVLEKGWVFRRADRRNRMLRAFASRTGSAVPPRARVKSLAAASKGSLVRVFGRHLAARE